MALTFSYDPNISGPARETLDRQVRLVMDLLPNKGLCDNIMKRKMLDEISDVGGTDLSEFSVDFGYISDLPIETPYGRSKFFMGIYSTGDRTMRMGDFVEEVICVGFVFRDLNDGGEIAFEDLWDGDKLRSYAVQTAIDAAKEGVEAVQKIERAIPDEDLRDILNI